MNNKFVQTILLFLLASAHSFGQNTQSKALDFTFSLGTSWQSTVFRAFNFGTIDGYVTTCSYNYEANIQGWSIADVGAKVYYPKAHVGLFFFPRIRYDYVTSNFDPDDKPYKQFLIDQNINAFTYLDKKQKHYLSLGYIFLNYGQSVPCNNLDPLDRDPIDFGGFSLAYAQNLHQKIYLEFKTICIPRGFPVERSSKFLMFNIRLYKDFGVYAKK